MSAPTKAAQALHGIYRHIFLLTHLDFTIPFTVLGWVLGFFCLVSQLLLYSVKFQPLLNTILVYWYECQWQADRQGRQMSHITHPMLAL